MKTAFERQKSSYMGTAHGRFLSLKDQKQTCSSLKNKNLPCMVGLRREPMVIDYRKDNKNSCL